MIDDGKVRYLGIRQYLVKTLVAFHTEVFDTL